MNSSNTIRAALMLVAAACCGNAMADTQNLTVSATVQGVCKFTSAARTLAFTIDPSAAGPIAGVMSGAVTYKCTNGTAGTGITASNGSNFTTSRRMSSGGATPTFLPYTLSLSGGTATGNGFGGSSTDNPITITGSVIAADYASLAAGGYTDTVLLTLTP